jgi:hypothetical protein
MKVLLVLMGVASSNDEAASALDARDCERSTVFEIAYGRETNSRKRIHNACG